MIVGSPLMVFMAQDRFRRRRKHVPVSIVTDEEIAEKIRSAQEAKGAPKWWWPFRRTS